MAGDVEVSNCDMCNKIANVSRKIYTYDVDCDCHSDKHFEIIRHCRECVPFEPKITTYSKDNKKVTVETSQLIKIKD